MWRVLSLITMASGLVVMPTQPRLTSTRAVAVPETFEAVVVTEEAPPAAEPVVAAEIKKEDPPPPPPPPVLKAGDLRLKRFANCESSVLVPSLPRPKFLDGSHAGDRGFDPLGIVTSNEDLYVQMEAEVKHARLGMLCAAGWPLAELWGDSSLLASNGRAPTVLNGHFFDSPAFFVTLAFFGILATREIENLAVPKRSKLYGHIHSQDYAAIEKEWPYGVAGDENFDPLGLYGLLGNDAIGRFVLRDLEIQHGRVAMLAVLSYVLLEATTGIPIVKLTPWLFNNF